MGKEIKEAKIEKEKNPATPIAPGGKVIKFNEPQAERGRQAIAIPSDTIIEAKGNILPSIREGKDVQENEPQIRMGKRVASIPPPTIAEV